MYNTKYVISGLVIFLAVFSYPFWGNLASKDYTGPKLSLPADQTQCIESAEYMRSEHMTLLNEWRDAALREEKRVYVASNGATWEASLQKTCMSCHTNKAEFCDACHLENAVEPYCWTCHVAPKGNE